jgi:hypothetical protein
MSVRLGSDAIHSLEHQVEFQPNQASMIPLDGKIRTFKSSWTSDTGESLALSEEHSVPPIHQYLVVTALKRLPWEVMPFVIGMFVMVESLDSSGWVEIFARGIEKLWTC